MAYSNEKKIEFKQTILNAIADGKSLKYIIENNNNFPNRKTIYEWLNPSSNYYDEEFCNNYIRAREESSDLDADNIQDIAEKTLTGEYDPAAARVAIDAYKWAAGIKKPKKYGNRIQTEHSGEITTNIISLGSGIKPNETIN